LSHNVAQGLQQLEKRSRGKIKRSEGSLVPVVYRSPPWSRDFYNLVAQNFGFFHLLHVSSFFLTLRNIFSKKCFICAFLKDQRSKRFMYAAPTDKALANLYEID
jgi:hypothetical protein